MIIRDLGASVLFGTDEQLILIIKGIPDEGQWNELVRLAYERGWGLYSDNPDIETEDVCVWWLEQVVK
jgi:hypothetical protein